MRWPWLVLAAAAVLLAGCGGGTSATAPGDAQAIAALRGKTIGVLTLTGPPALETRYVFKQRYHLDVNLAGGDATFLEAPQQSVAPLFADGTIAAAVVTNASAFALANDDAYRTVSHVSQEMRGLTGAPVLTSVLATYRDVAEQKGEALGEANRMLAQSAIYARSNKGRIVDALASEQGIDSDYLRWWLDRSGLVYGDTSVDTQRQLLQYWEAAKAVGDIDEYPDLTTVFFDAAAVDGEGAAPGDRVTISVALLGDPGRRAAMFAIDRGLVTSDLVDLSITYLPASALADAELAREFDVIEADPLAVPRSLALHAGLIVLAGGVQDLDTTLLLVPQR